MSICMAILDQSHGRERQGIPFPGCLMLLDSDVGITPAIGQHHHSDLTGRNAADQASTRGSLDRESTYGAR